MTTFKALSALALVCAATTASAQEKVMVGEPSWPGAKIMSRVIAQVIETRLGGETDFAPARTPLFSPQWMADAVTLMCIPMSGCQTRRLSQTNM